MTVSSWLEELQNGSIVKDLTNFIKEEVESIKKKWIRGDTDI